jgi:hypothetical protein
VPPSRQFFLRIAGWTAAPLIGALLLISTVESYSPEFSIPLMFLFAFIGALAIALAPVALVLAIKDRQWLGMGAVLTGLATAALLVAPTWWAGDYIHLATAYLQHSDEFARANGRPVSVAWSSNGFAGSYCDNSLVYDTTGRNGEGSGSGVIHLRLTGRFFVRADCH